MAAFHIDHDVPIRITSVLQGFGHTTYTARDLGMQHAKDYEHLQDAAATQRILVTSNRRDFELLHGAWQAWGQAWGYGAPQHAGILALDQHTADALAYEVNAFLNRVPGGAPAPTNRLFWWRRSIGWQEWRRSIGWQVLF